MLNEAIIYGSLGWKVFPVKHKIPAVKGWQTLASSNKDEITQLFNTPNTGIGLATGKTSGITVLDIDNKNGVNGFKTLEALGINLPNTVCVLTPSGGRQYYFQYNQELKNMVAALGEGCGIDIRNDGGLVIVPPSIHPNGKPYEWLSDQAPGEIELAAFPSDLLKIIQEQSKPSNEAFVLPEKIPSGKRNDTLFKYACKLRTSGLEVSEIQAATYVLNLERCAEPLSIEEIQLIVDSACKYEKGQAEESKREDITLLIAEKYLSENGHIAFCIEENSFYKFIDGYYQKTPSEKIQKNLIDKIPYVRKLAPSKRGNILDNIRVLKNHQLEEFNNGEILNLQNGIYDIKNRCFFKHDPKFLCTIRLPYNYVADQDCPKWTRTLNEIFEEDQNKIRTIQEFFGYCLTRDTHFEKALLMVGDGQNGKSTVIYVLENLVGQDNCSTLSLKYFNDPSMLCTLVNKLVNINSEVPRRAEDYESEFKTIVSGEYITANQKYAPVFKFRPYAKLIFAANDLPYVDDRSVAFYRRLLMVPFERSFTEEEQNKSLKNELILELPGIFNWAIAGLKRLYERKTFLVDEYMKKTISMYRRQNNPIESFIDEMVGFEKDVFIYKSDLFDKYKRWCEENGYKALATHKFSEAFFRSAKKFTKKDERCGHDSRKIWPGVFLKSENKELFERKDYISPEDRPY